MNQDLRDAVQTLIKSCDRATSVLERLDEDTPVREIARSLEDMNDYARALDREAGRVQRLLDLEDLAVYQMQRVTQSTSVDVNTRQA